MSTNVVTAGIARASNNRILMLAAVHDKVLGDADLADIDPTFVESCQPWLAMVTDPISSYAPLVPFVEQMIAMSGRTASKEMVTQTILELLHTDISFANAYQGTISRKVGRRARKDAPKNQNRVTASKQFSIAVRESHRIFQRLTALLPTVFGGLEVAVEQFYRVLLVAFRHYRSIYESMREVQASKDEQRQAARQQRGMCGQVLAENGVNPKFGILATVDKKFLAAIAPGRGTQKDKIRRARDAPTLRINGGCSAELNPPEQGLRCYVMSHVKTRLSQDEIFRTSPDPKVKRQRVNVVAENVLCSAAPLIEDKTEGMDEAAIHRLVYNPVTYAKIQNEIS